MCCTLVKAFIVQLENSHEGRIVDFALKIMQCIFTFTNLFCLQMISDFKKWWPSWNGERAGSTALSFDRQNYMGISMKRKFDFVKPRRNRQQTVERFIDYYFWGLRELQSKLPFICQKPKKNIGCVVGLLNNQLILTHNLSKHTALYLFPFKLKPSQP